MVSLVCSLACSSAPSWSRGSKRAATRQWLLGEGRRLKVPGEETRSKINRQVQVGKAPRELAFLRAPFSEAREARRGTGVLRQRSLR